jgi:hypothetical protein
MECVQRRFKHEIVDETVNSSPDVMHFAGLCWNSAIYSSFDRFCLLICRCIFANDCTSKVLLDLSYSDVKNPIPFQAHIASMIHGRNGSLQVLFPCMCYDERKVISRTWALRRSMRYSETHPSNVAVHSPPETKSGSTRQEKRQNR